MNYKHLSHTYIITFYSHIKIVILQRHSDDQNSARSTIWKPKYNRFCLPLDFERVNRFISALKEKLIFPHRAISGLGFVKYLMVASASAPAFEHFTTEVCMSTRSNRGFSVASPRTSAKLTRNEECLLNFN